MMNYRHIISTTLFLLLYSIVNGQDERLADSFKILYYNNEGDVLVNLDEITRNEINPDSILKYAELLIEKSLIDSNDYMSYIGYLEKGNAWMYKGDMDIALESYFTSLDYSKKINNNTGIGQLNISIADIYAETANYDIAMTYYNQGIHILRQTDDSMSLAVALLNAGDSYVDLNKLDSALILTVEAEKIFHDIDYPNGQAYGHGNIGVIYAHLGDRQKAERNINTAVKLLSEYEDYSAISAYYIYMSEIYFEQGELNSSIEFAKQSLELAKSYGLKDLIRDSNLLLSELYENDQDHLKAINHYKEHILYRDSVIDLETQTKFANLNARNRINDAKAEVMILEKEKTIQRNRNIALSIILILSILILASLFWFYKQITKEKKKSDNLLLNILPKETAEELKEYGHVEAKRFESVTVMFADIKGFTQVSEKLTPNSLVKTIDFYFSKFDEIIEKYDLEKIKTIGDAYMCAGGVPDISEDHATKMIDASFEILDYVDKLKKDNPNNEVRFDIRIGINSGPVVAGVVGTKKFAYDIYGDTVNIASRMESNSISGKINISEYTYQLIKDLYDFEYRGEIEVKNKGMMKMYYVNKSL